MIQNASNFAFFSIETNRGLRDLDVSGERKTNYKRRAAQNAQPGTVCPGKYPMADERLFK